MFLLCILNVTEVGQMKQLHMNEPHTLYSRISWIKNDTWDKRFRFLTVIHKYVDFATRAKDLLNTFLWWFLSCSLVTRHINIQGLLIINTVGTLPRAYEKPVEYIFCVVKLITKIGY